MVALPTATLDDKSSQDHTIWLHGWPAIHCAQIDSAKPSDSDEAQKQLELDLFSPELGILYDSKKSLKENESRMVYWSLNAYYHSQTSCFTGRKPQKFWSDSKNWRLFGSNRNSRWFALGFAINVLCFIGYAISLATLLEWLRRRKQRWYQLTILEYGIAFAAFGLSTTIAVNAYRDVAAKSKAMNDFAESSQHQLTGWILVDSPVWFDRLTNLSFDMEARGRWFGWVDTRVHNSATPLPYFAQVDSLEIGNPIEDIDKAVSAIEILQPEKLRLGPGIGVNTELIRRLNGRGIKHLELSAELLNSEASMQQIECFPDLEFLTLTGDIGPGHLEAISRLPLKSLSVYGLLDRPMWDLIAEMENLEILSIEIASGSMLDLARLPRKVRHLYVNINSSPSPVESANSNQNRARDSEEVVLSNLSSLTELQNLSLHHRNQEPPVLLRVGKGCQPIQTLMELEIGGFVVDESTSSWIKSNRQLKLLRIYGPDARKVLDDIKIHLPGVNPW